MWKHRDLRQRNRSLAMKIQRFVWIENEYDTPLYSLTSLQNSFLIERANILFLTIRQSAHSLTHQLNVGVLNIELSQICNF